MGEATMYNHSKKLHEQTHIFKMRENYRNMDDLVELVNNHNGAMRALPSHAPPRGKVPVPDVVSAKEQREALLAQLAQASSCVQARRASAGAPNVVPRKRSTKLVA